MPAKRKDTGSKGGRPTGSKATKIGGQVAEADLHPELQSNWMELKPIVYDDEKIADVNEIHKIIKECAAHIAKKEARNYSAYFKQMVDMFNVMAFNSLKGTAACFKNVVKCKHVFKYWNDAISNYHIVEEYQQLIGVHFPTGRLPSLFLDYVDSMRSIKPTNPVKTLDEWIYSNHKDKASYTQQQKQTVFLGHIILVRASHSTAESRNRINPLWNPNDIPSGHSMSDHLRAIRFQIFKIAQYKLSLYNLSRAADWKSGVWDQVEKLNQVRSDMETRLLSWVPEFTYPNDWLAFLVCSFPIDHYTGRKLSLDGVVPAINPAVIPQPASTSGKPTRRDERAAAASVPGTATHAAEDARLKRARHNDEVANGGGVSEVTITMNHNINKNGSRPFLDQVFPDNNDDTIAGLRSQLDTTKQLIVNLQELGAEKYIQEIKSYKLSIIQLLQEILELQKQKSLSMKQHKVSILQASNSIVQNAMDSIGVSVASMRTPSIRELREQRMFADQNKLPVPDNKDTLQEPQKRKVPKKMDEEIFNRKMEEKWGPVNDNTLMP